MKKNNFIVLLCIFFLKFNLIACSCSNNGTIKQNFDLSDIVVTGTVTKIELVKIGQEDVDELKNSFHN
ncbi:MAG: hypothetical protein RLZZ292_3689 [Bacteroidota bacterium]|jgi:hypothetical protein